MCSSGLRKSPSDAESPNKPLQLTRPAVTKFAYANLSPSARATERRRYAVEAETTRPASGASFSVVRERLGIR